MLTILLCFLCYLIVSYVVFALLRQWAQCSSCCAALIVFGPGSLQEKYFDIVRTMMNFDLDRIADLKACFSCS